jgi:hypothetical protein
MSPRKGGKVATLEYDIPCLKRFRIGDISGYISRWDHSGLKLSQISLRWARLFEKVSLKVYTKKHRTAHYSRSISALF